MDALMKTADVARLIGYTHMHVNILCRKGKLKCEKLCNGHWRIYSESVIEYLKGKKKNYDKAINRIIEARDLLSGE